MNRRFFLALFAALAAASLTSCARRIQAPVEPFQRPLSEETIVQRMEERHPPLDSLREKMKLVADGGILSGKHRFYLLVFYRKDPFGLTIKADHHPAGEFLRYVQRDDDILIYFREDDQAFLGKAEDLEGRPDALFGLAPRDALSVLLGPEEATQLLARERDGRRLPPPGFLHKYWTVRGGGEGDAPERVYKIRRSDGLLERLVIRDADGKASVRAHYLAYREIDGMLMPSRFRIDAELSGRTVHFDVEAMEGEVRPDYPVKSRHFPLSPPSDAEVHPLGAFSIRVK